MTKEDETQTFTWHPDEGRTRRVIAFWDGGHTSRLLGDEAVAIGRSLDCDLTILHPSVSRQHAEVLGGDRVRVRDLGSANGTRVNGTLLRAHEDVAIGAGDVVEVGSAVIVVRSPVDTPVLAPDGDDATEQVAKLVKLVAPSELSVIVLGETGVGKEMTARAIHEGSARASKPFVRVNCAALTDSLLDSELFGHEKGAFTGATTAKIGLIESAHGGSLLLDEIGESPLNVQAKLLRTLESREVRRVGGTDTRTIDVRFVVATNRDLPALVEAGTFRRDLYYRLNGLTIHVPPLRARRHQILPLARSFAKGASRGGEPQFSAAAEAALLAHPFPGNVRELKHVVERALVLAAGRGEILAEHLRIPSTPGLPTGAMLPTSDLPERARIIAALDRAAGNQTTAAKLLGISRRTLINRIVEYGIPRPRKA